MVTVHQGDLEFFGEERISQIAWWRYKFLQGVLGSLVVTKTFLEVKLVDLEFQSCFQVILKKLPDCPFHLNFLLTANLQPGCDMTKKSLGWQGLQMHGNSVQIFRSCCSFGMKVKRLFRQFPQQPWKLIPMGTRKPPMMGLESPPRISQKWLNIYRNPQFSSIWLEILCFL